VGARRPWPCADAGSGEPIMPAQLLAEGAADERCEKRTDIDADVEDRIGAVAPMVARRVEAADLGRDIGLEGAVAEDEHEERQQEQRLERHHEMADRHQCGAEDHGAALTEHVIGKPTSKERGQVNKPGIETINLRCEGCRAGRTCFRARHAGMAELVRRESGIGWRDVVERIPVTWFQAFNPFMIRSLPVISRPTDRESARPALGLDEPADPSRRAATRPGHARSLRWIRLLTGPLCLCEAAPVRYSGSP
jgi:hypothetical protein